MDVQRESQGRSKQVRYLTYGGAAIAAIVVLGISISSLKSAAPSVERSTVWIDTVKRGPMLRQVRGVGTLIPEESIWIPAATEGRVERIIVKPGTEVKRDTVVLEMASPELEQTAVETEMQLKEAEAELANLRVQLESQELNRAAAAATVKAEYSQARMQAEVNEALAKEGLVSDLMYRQSKVKAEELATRHQIEQKRLAISGDAVKAQIDVQEARVAQERARARIKRDQVDALRVRAGIDGVLQQVPVEVGQRVASGANLARVANPSRLKAEIRVPETQAKDIAIGQPASIDTRNGVVAGRVARIDPAVQNGTVTVDITIDGDLPKGARPDLSVDGTIEIVRLSDVTYVGRPVFAQEHAAVSLFKLDRSGKRAVRTPVKLGRSSVSTIEVLDGLQPGDQVILSDMSQWADADRVRLR